MRPELERLQRIEYHLLEPSTAPAEVLWAARQLLDPMLGPDVEAQQQVYKELQLAGRRQLRQELSAIHARLYGGPRPPRRWLQQAATVLQQLRRQLGRRR